MSAGMLAGSGRNTRLDPFALPVRYKAADGGADTRERIVEIRSDRVVMQRSVRGISMKVSTYLRDFLGVAIRIVPPKNDFEGAIAVMLEHRDPGLAVPLFVATDGREVSVEWSTWARVLGLPALVEDAQGRLHDPFGPLGRIRAAEFAAKRRRGRALRSRRGLGRLRRKPGVINTGESRMHDGEREIIARN
jgi:hypothetical protein